MYLDIICIRAVIRIRLRVILDSFFNNCIRFDLSLLKIRYDIQVEDDIYVSKLIQHHFFFNSIDAIAIVFSEYHTKGLFMPPEGISRREFPIVSINTKSFIFTPEPEFLIYK